MAKGFQRVTPPALKEIGIGMLGYGFMGKAHTNALKKIPYIFWEPALKPKLVAIAGRTEEKVRNAAIQYGYEGYYLDWQEMVQDPRIELFDNVAWHSAHAESCIAAAEAGKHVLCEKPLATNAGDAKRMRDAAVKAGVKHMTAFNYRFAPANRLAYHLIREGYLGRIYSVRIRYLQEHGSFPDRPYLDQPGKAGVLLGLGSHVVDMARFLVGEPKTVSGTLRTFIKERPSAVDPTQKVTMRDDDTFSAVVEFENGATGVLEASYACRGRKNQFAWEISGEKGSLAWDLEDLNRLHVHLDSQKAPKVQGFENVLVTEAEHELMENWWPHGHILSWEHLHINMMYHLLEAIAGLHNVEPYGATFEDGYRAAVVCDAIEESYRSGGRVEINYE